MAELRPELLDAGRQVARKMLGGEELDAGLERQLGQRMSARFSVVKAAGTDGLCIAWFPWDNDGDEDDDFATKLAGLGGNVAAADLHLTLVYLGDPANFDLDLVAAVTKMETVWAWPLDGEVSGLGRFVGDGDQDVIVALVDCPGLDRFRDCLLDKLACYGVFPESASEHGFLPHITLGYVSRGTASPVPLTATIPFTLDAVSVAAGQTRAAYDFKQSEDAPEEATAAPFYAARDALAVAKAGRVLSGKNLAALQAAHEEMGKVIERELARQAKPEEDDTQKEAGEPLDYVVTKATEEQRYTFGPLYAPERKDAHGEWTDAETLQKAVWDYVQECVDKGSNRINLQHGAHGDVQVGRWVDVVAWPYETTVKMSVPGEAEREVTLPANTVYMGVIWNEDTWPAVKNRQLTGLSLGGRAVRVAEGAVDMAHMGDKVLAKFAAHAYVPQDSGGGVCKVCHMSRGDGNHAAGDD